MTHHDDPRQPDQPAGPSYHPQPPPSPPPNRAAPPDPPKPRPDYWSYPPPAPRPQWAAPSATPPTPMTVAPQPSAPFTPAAPGTRSGYNIPQGVPAYAPTPGHPSAWSAPAHSAWTTTASAWSGPRPSMTPGGSYAAAPPPRKPGKAGPVSLVVVLLLAVALVYQVLVGGLFASPTMRELHDPRPRVEAPAVPQGPIQTYQTEVTAELSAGVVLIVGESHNGNSAGSGIILSESGLVLTNYHVVADTSALQVEVADGGARYTATLLGRNAWEDVAVLQLENASGLTVAKLDDDGVRVGDEVIAVGNGNGEGRLVATGGSVNELDAAITLPSAFGGYGVDRLSGLIRSSAGAVPGYSGGPTFDTDAEVVGVTSAGRDEVSDDMITYSIPIDTAMEIANDIINQRESEQTRVGPGPWLGVTIGSENVTVLTSVNPDSPAARAGLTAGSTITSYRGVQITTASELLKLLESSDPGEVIELTWINELGEAREGSVTLGTSPTN